MADVREVIKNFNLKHNVTGEDIEIEEPYLSLVCYALHIGANEGYLFFKDLEKDRDKDHLGVRQW